MRASGSGLPLPPAPEGPRKPFRGLAGSCSGAVSGCFQQDSHSLAEAHQLVVQSVMQMAGARSARSRVEVFLVDQADARGGGSSRPSRKPRRSRMPTSSSKRWPAAWPTRSSRLVAHADRDRSPQGGTAVPRDRRQ